MIALDFFVIFAFNLETSIVKSSLLISTKTGLAPAPTIEFAVATNVNDGSKTSSPCLTPAESNAA